jgi:hypothetical protein
MAELNTQEVAKKLGTDAKTLRRFLRATQQGVGPGGRYAIDAKRIPTLKKQFTTWQNADAERKAKHIADLKAGKSKAPAKARTKKVESTPEVEQDAPAEA